MTEERHLYDLVGTFEHDDGRTIHLRCPICGKEVSHTVLFSDEPATCDIERTPKASTSTNYKVLSDIDGNLLQGDFAARHSWSTNIALDEPEVRRDHHDLS